MRTITCLAAMAFALSQSAIAQTRTGEGEDELVGNPNPKVMADAFAGLGGGAFTQDVGRVSEGGFAFNARFGVDGTGFLRFTGAEVAYQGLRTNTGLQNGNIYGGVIGANLRANLPINVGKGMVKPYLLGGIGWSHITVNDDLAGTTIGTTSNVPVGLDGDDALAVPLGGGVSYFFQNGFGLDGRFVYNILTGTRAPLLDSGDSWSVAVNAGGHWGW